MRRVIEWATLRQKRLLRSQIKLYTMPWPMTWLLQKWRWLWGHNSTKYCEFTRPSGAIHTKLRTKLDTILVSYWPENHGRNVRMMLTFSTGPSNVRQGRPERNKIKHLAKHILTFSKAWLYNAVLARLCYSYRLADESVQNFSPNFNCDPQK